MFALFLAQVIGSVLAISPATAAAGESTSSVGRAGDASGQAAATPVTTAEARQLPYSRLFSVPETDTMRMSEPAVRLGGATLQDTTSAAADIVCGMRVLRGNPDVDSGIFMPRRDAHVDFTIRRVTPPCLDRSLVVPRRER